MQSGNRHGPVIRRGAGILALLLAMGLALVPDAGADPIHRRDGVIFGIGIGVSSGKATLFPGDEELRVESGWKKGVVPQMRLGYAVVKNRLLVMVANQQWLYEQGILAEDKMRINAQNWNLVLNWYPGNLNNHWGGLYFQAGAGYANNRLTLLEPIEDDPHGNKFEEVFKVDEQGVIGDVTFKGTGCAISKASASLMTEAVKGKTLDEAEAIKKSAQLFEMGVMVIGFGFPVVPKGEARLRVQVSAALTNDHIQQALDAFAKL